MNIVLNFKLGRTMGWLMGLFICCSSCMANITDGLEQDLHLVGAEWDPVAATIVQLQDQADTINKSVNSQER